MSAEPDDSPSEETTDGPIEPAVEAEQVANLLISSEKVQRTVLMETVEAAKQGRITESGRTICPDSSDAVRPPFNRFPKAVQLSSCPVGVAATIHSHTSWEQLRNPTHSLPDMAGTLFLDEEAASMVVGLNESDLLMAAADPEAAREAFREVVGFEVTSAMDVVELLEGGMIDDPEAVREEVRQRLSPLFMRVSTPFPDIEMQMQNVAIPALSVAGVAAAAHPRHPTTAPGKFREKCSRCSDSFARMAGASNISVREIAIGQVIGTVAGTLTQRVIFGS